MSVPFGGKRNGVSPTINAVELANWGTNDTVVLTDIATKIGTTATEFIEIAGNNY